MTGDDSGPSDIEQRCMLGCGFGMGVSAVGRHHTDGSVSLKVGDYTEDVDYCPECGKPNGPIEELEALAERMENPGNPPWLGTTSAQELREVIEQYE